MIPRMIKFKIKTTNTKNVLRSFVNDVLFHCSLNKFRINNMRIGPFEKEMKNIDLTASNARGTFTKFKLRSENINNSYWCGLVIL